MPFVLIYLDDILIFSKAEEDHTQHLKAVFWRLCKQKVYVKLSKCKFFLKTVNWLGYTIGKDGIGVNEEKVKAIMKIQPLVNVTQV